MTDCTHDLTLAASDSTCGAYTWTCDACDATGGERDKSRDTYNKTGCVYDGTCGASSKTNNTYHRTCMLHDGHLSHGEIVVHVRKSRPRGLAMQATQINAFFACI